MSRSEQRWFQEDDPSYGLLTIGSGQRSWIGDVVGGVWVLSNDDSGIQGHGCGIAHVWNGIS